MLFRDLFLPPESVSIRSQSLFFETSRLTNVHVDDVDPLFSFFLGLGLELKFPLIAIECDHELVFLALILINVAEIKVEIKISLGLPYAAFALFIVRQNASIQVYVPILPSYEYGWTEFLEYTLFPFWFCLRAESCSRCD